MSTIRWVDLLSSESNFSHSVTKNDDINEKLKKKKLLYGKENDLNSSFLNSYNADLDNSNVGINLKIKNMCITDVKEKLAEVTDNTTQKSGVASTIKCTNNSEKENWHNALDGNKLSCNTNSLNNGKSTHLQLGAEWGIQTTVTYGVSYSNKVEKTNNVEKENDVEKRNETVAASHITATNSVVSANRVFNEGARKTAVPSENAQNGKVSRGRDCSRRSIRCASYARLSQGGNNCADRNRSKGGKKKTTSNSSVLLSASKNRKISNVPLEKKDIKNSFFAKYIVNKGENKGENKGRKKGEKEEANKGTNKIADKSGSKSANKHAFKNVNKKADKQADNKADKKADTRPNSGSTHVPEGGVELGKDGRDGKKMCHLLSIPADDIVGTISKGKKRKERNGSVEKSLSKFNCTASHDITVDENNVPLNPAKKMKNKSKRPQQGKKQQSKGNPDGERTSNLVSNIPLENAKGDREINRNLVGECLSSIVSQVKESNDVKVSEMEEGVIPNIPIIHPYHNSINDNINVEKFNNFNNNFINYLGDIRSNFTESIYSVNSNRVHSRLKEIAVGKSTKEYKNYVRLVKYEERMDDDPSTPNAYENITNAKFQAKYNLWRKKLHKFDNVG
ncbi:conserved Plasmodium protein, unknown function [Plasmodium ovale]|uniref:Histone RNA hairpin-binding protein RNA-binding domain-containing protein n=1 Tax=Plasmodium ovale TaxID=36330 RepID=A0A1D3U831_PLAOA|nr:conserved Plasmodium protein, unknown function [Plasmodium ovale]